MFLKVVNEYNLGGWRPVNYGSRVSISWRVATDGKVGDAGYIKAESDQPSGSIAADGTGFIIPKPPELTAQVVAPYGDIHQHFILPPPQPDPIPSLCFSVWLKSGSSNDISVKVALG